MAGRDLSDDADAGQIRHRFKNYQQMVLSLVKLQARRSTPETARALADLLARIEVVGLVNEDMGTGEAPAPLDQLLPAVAARIAQVVDPARSHELVVAIPQAKIDPRRAGILGQALAELLLNAYRHGASGRDGAAIRVALERDGEGWRLDVADDGAVPAEGDALPRPGLGLTLAAGLVRNLGGTLTHRRDGGIVAQVHFPA